MYRGPSWLQGTRGASSPLSEIRHTHKEMQLQSCLKDHKRVDSFVTASKTKHQKSGDLKQLKFISSQFWELKVQSQGGHTLSEDSEGGAFLFSSRFLFVVSPPRHSVACMCVTAASAFMATWSSPCVSVFRQPSWQEDTSVIGLGVHPTLVGPYLNWFDLQWLYFQIRSYLRSAS